MQIRRLGAVVILRPEDTELGADVAEAFKAEGLAVIPPQGGMVAVDLAGIEFMDSSGLSALVALLKRTRPAGSLVLFGVGPAVREILRLTRLDGVFPVCESEAEALSWFSQDDQNDAEGSARRQA
ncbi:MAG: STAS domain-containing protein [Candidatus Eisenbacteria bacterium]|nr:STAS domain-containing protein [Candidatus Eisenbacteria bacterium]